MAQSAGSIYFIPVEEFGLKAKYQKTCFDVDKMSAENISFSNTENFSPEINQEYKIILYFESTKKCYSVSVSVLFKEQVDSGNLIFNVDYNENYRQFFEFCKISDNLDDFEKNYLKLINGIDQEYLDTTYLERTERTTKAKKIFSTLIFLFIVISLSLSCVYIYAKKKSNVKIENAQVSYKQTEYFIREIDGFTPVFPDYKPGEIIYPNDNLALYCENNQFGFFSNFTGLRNLTEGVILKVEKPQKKGIFKEIKSIGSNSFSFLMLEIEGKTAKKYFVAVSNQDLSSLSSDKKAFVMIADNRYEGTYMIVPHSELQNYGIDPKTAQINDAVVVFTSNESISDDELTRANLFLQTTFGERVNEFL